MTFEDIIELIFVEDYIPEFIDEAFAIYHDMSSIELTPNDVKKIVDEQYSEKFNHIAYLSVKFKMDKLEKFVENEYNKIIQKTSLAD